MFVSESQEAAAAPVSSADVGTWGEWGQYNYTWSYGLLPQTTRFYTIF